MNVVCRYIPSPYNFKLYPHIVSLYVLSVYKSDICCLKLTTMESKLYLKACYFCEKVFVIWILTYGKHSNNRQLKPLQFFFIWRSSCKDIYVWEISSPLYNFSFVRTPSIASYYCISAVQHSPSSLDTPVWPFLTWRCYKFQELSSLSSRKEYEKWRELLKPFFL